MRDRRKAAQAVEAVAVVHERLRPHRQRCAADFRVGPLKRRRQRVGQVQPESVADKADLRGDRVSAEMAMGESEKQAPATMTRILESTGQKPLLLTLSREPYVDLVQTFALVSDRGDLVTDWPLQPSFPLPPVY